MGSLHRFRSATWFVFALVFGAGIFWFVATAPAQAVPPAAPGSTTTTVFTLKGGAKVQVDNLTAQAQAIQAQIDTLDDELEQKTEEYNKCLDDLDAANTRMSELRRMIADAQADKAHRQTMLARAHQEPSTSPEGRDQLLQLLLLANGIEDLYNRVRLGDHPRRSGPASCRRPQGKHEPARSPLEGRATIRSVRNWRCGSN